MSVAAAAITNKETQRIYRVIYNQVRNSCAGGTKQQGHLSDQHFNYHNYL